jgi:small nuclear ribonucleoprotein (snRNP)-like protein
MSPAVVVSVVALVAVVALAGLLLYRSRTGVLYERRRRRVIVTLKDGQAFSGVLYSTDHEALVLREAEALAYGPKRENVIVEGEALLLRAEVAYLQVL